MLTEGMRSTSRSAYQRVRIPTQESKTLAGTAVHTVLSAGREYTRRKRKGSGGRELDQQKTRYFSKFRGDSKGERHPIPKARVTGMLVKMRLEGSAFPA